METMERSKLNLNVKKRLMAETVKPPDPPKKQKYDAGWLYRFFANVSVFGITLLITVALAEAALRVVPLPVVDRLQAQQNVTLAIDEVHPKGLYTIAKNGAWSLAPHFDDRFAKNDFNIRVRANLDGIRDADRTVKSPGVYRILGLGDSFAFGWGVENEESFLKVLERKLNQDPGFKSAGMTFDVINAGIPGYGTYEAGKLLEKIGPKYRPDMILLAFYEGNDFKNNADAPRKRAIENGYLKDVTEPKPAWVRMILSTSIVAALIDAGITQIKDKLAFRQGLEKTKQYLLEIKAYALANKIPLTVIYIPDQDPEFYSRPEWLRKYDRWVGGFDFYDARSFMRGFALLHDIHFYQLSEAFENAPDSGTRRLADTHFNPQGHALAAKEVEEFLKTVMP